MPMPCSAVRSGLGLPSGNGLWLQPIWRSALACSCWKTTTVACALCWSCKQQGSAQGKVSAAVISRSSRGWWQQLQLGKGSLQGIGRSDAVLGPGGLVGRIDSVTPATARVKLLTAPGHEIGVWLPRSRRHGLLVGRGSSRLSLRFIDKDPDVRPGDLVATSPASTLLPPNVPVGVIQSVDEQAVPAPVAVVQLIAAPEAIDWVQVQTR